MSLKSKVLNIKHSFKYKSFQFLKFYFFKNRFKKNREVSLSLLKEDSDVIELDQNFLKNKFPFQYDDFKKINDAAIKKFLDISKDNNIKLHGVQYPELLYIILQIINPIKVLETGVWLGLSTNSILSSGIKNNKEFLLDSIDLPRADIKNAEKYIGILINKKFKKNWNLYIGKDRAIAGRLIKKNKYNFYYFDSDKSLSGKLFLLRMVLKNTKDYLIIFDDLEDNLFWYRKELKNLSKVAIKYESKYLGLIYSRKYEKKIKEIYE